MIFQPDYSSSGLQAAGASPSGSGQKANGMPFHHRAHSLPLRLGRFTQASPHTCTALGCGRELEYPENTHTDMGKHGNSTQMVVLARNQNNFFLIVLAKRC